MSSFSSLNGSKTPELLTPLGFYISTFSSSSSNLWIDPSHGSSSTGRCLAVGIWGGFTLSSLSENYYYSEASLNSFMPRTPTTSNSRVSPGIEVHCAACLPSTSTRIPHRCLPLSMDRTELYFLCPKPDPFSEWSYHLPGAHSWKPVQNAWLLLFPLIRAKLAPLSWVSSSVLWGPWGQGHVWVIRAL